MKIDLTINTSVARTILTGFIRSEVTRVGYSRGVIGLSGGIDSALSCALAVEALGRENVLAVRMPYKSSSPESLTHAQILIEQLEIPSTTIEITDMVNPLFNLDSNITKLRKGNIMARERMIVLYDQSEVFKGLVIGTSNKTEILLGYSTQSGDAASAINPIGDLYKSQVRQLSRAMNIPSEILEKAPSADLWEGQTDEDELGFAYEEADELLYLLVDQRYSPQECVEVGFDPSFVDTVVARVRRSQFKRMQPPIAKLSNRTIGYDFLYLRDWGS
ncbi:MAG TPA: NAD(+) synthetase [Anaerolineae bacterium]|nr:NAD(+) synthetase [Anaerolineae bacterium]